MRKLLKKKWEDEVKNTLIHMLADDTCTLKDILPIFDALAPDGVYLVANKERAILASNKPYSKDMLQCIYDLKYLGEEVYLDYEKNGLHFPKGITCIQVVPLTRDGAFLCIFLTSYKKVEFGSSLDVLRIATRYLAYEQERDSEEIQHTTEVSLRLCRDDLIGDIQRASNDAFLAMFQIEKRKARYLEQVMQEKLGDMVYLYGEGLLCAIFVRGSFYEGVSVMEEIIMALMERKGIEVRSILSPIHSDKVYEQLYTMESRIGVSKLGVVTTIMEPEEILDGTIRREYILDADKIKEVNTTQGKEEKEAVKEPFDVKGFKESLHAFFQTEE